jgi:hypothetical protein
VTAKSAGGSPAARRTSAIRFLPWQPARRSKKSPLHERRSPEPCRRRDCPTQAGRSSRRARWEALCHTTERDGATRRGLRRIKRAPADPERSRSSCLRHSSAVWTGRPRLRGTRDDRNAVRVARRLTGTDCSNPFSSTGESYKPDHSDRSGAGRRAALETGECRWTGKTQMTITRREILHRVPRG